MAVYVPERFTAEEADVLRRYFTNLDGPVFALVNLPEVVKGALFARYSRSPKSLRRLFLDEFVNDLDISGDESVDATIGLDLPMKVLAWQTADGKVMIGYTAPDALAGRHAITDRAEVLATMTKALDGLTNAAAGAPKP